MGTIDPLRELGFKGTSLLTTYSVQEGQPVSNMLKKSKQKFETEKPV